MPGHARPFGDLYVGKVAATGFGYQLGSLRLGFLPCFDLLGRLTDSLGKHFVAHLPLVRHFLCLHGFARHGNRVAEMDTQKAPPPSEHGRRGLRGTGWAAVGELPSQPEV